MPSRASLGSQLYLLVLVFALGIEHGPAHAEIIGPFPGIEKLTTQSQMIAIIHLNARVVFIDGSWQQADPTPPWTLYDPIMGTRSGIYDTFTFSPLAVIKGTTASLVNGRVALCNLNVDAFGGPQAHGLNHFDPLDREFIGWMRRHPPEQGGTFAPNRDLLVFLDVHSDPMYPVRSINVPGSTVILNPGLARTKLPAGSPAEQVRWIIRANIAADQSMKEANH